MEHDMSNEKNDGGPAFPTDGLREYGFTGMALRDWFAGQAMAALIDSSFLSSWKAGRNNQSYAQLVSCCAYEQADAMLKAREQ
jgi:hypothetical protein